MFTTYYYTAPNLIKYEQPADAHPHNSIRLIIYSISNIHHCFIINYDGKEQK